jgi:hypothetical protein
MAQPLGNDLGVYALAEHQLGAGMAEVVNAESGHHSCVPDGVPRAKHVAGLQRRSDTGREYEVVVLIGAAGQQSRFDLLSSVASENCHCVRRDSNRATRETCFRLPEDDALAADALRRLLDMQRCTVEVDVAPTQSEQLAASQACQQR